MTTPSRLDRELEAWLAADGPSVARPEVVDVAIAAARRLPQSRDWLGPLRLPVTFGSSRRLGVVLIGLMALALLAGAIYLAGSRVTTPLPRANGWLAYSNGSEIVAIEPGGSARRTLVAAPADIVVDAPAFSPDGQWLAYWRTNADGTSAIGLVAMAADGRDVTDLVDFGADFNTAGQPAPADGVIAWSPDSRRIAVASANRFSSSFYVLIVGLDGRSTSVSTGAVFGGDVVWSPDGSQFVVRGHLQSQATVGLWLVNTGGTGQIRPLSPQDGLEFDYLRPEFSPDGREVLVFRAPVSSGQHDIVAFSVASGARRDISTDPADEFWPAWSPDGRYVAWQADAGNGLTEVFVSEATGANKRLITTTSDPVGVGPMVWSPDGRSIVLMSCRSRSNCNASLLILPVVSGGIRLEQPVTQLVLNAPRLEFSWQAR